MAKPRRAKHVTLPHGGALGWDMTKLSLEQLEYEQLVSWEALYGSYDASGDVKLLSGLYDRRNTYEARGHEDLFNKAVSVFEQRLKRAQDELFEREVLLEKS